MPKIAIPAVSSERESRIDPRFGRAKQFCLYETETKEMEFIDNAQSLNAPSGAGIQAAQTIIDAGNARLKVITAFTFSRHLPFNFTVSKPLAKE